MTVAFTPSILSPDVLEALHVPRGRLLEQVMDRVVGAVSSDERAHTLLIGPRGSGKTHLISLLHHRTVDLIRKGARAQIAWLPEDPWGVTSYPRLLQAIMAVSSAQAVRDIDGLEADLVGRSRAHGPVVCFIENVDRVLEAIGEIGQSRLRFLAQEGHLLLIATSTTVTRDLADQARPFYAFFATHRLAPMDLDQATEMLVRLAEHRGDTDIVDLLRSGRARPRLAAVAHLAGGQPRIWHLLSRALTIEGLEDLAGTLINRLDDLTPYYQEQLARLSIHQREVVLALAEADRAMTPRSLADSTGIDQRSLARTLVDLRERGWVRVVNDDHPGVDRRLSFYELAEPLLRLALQIKMARGTPVPLVVDFLTYWLDDLPSDASTEAVQYVTAVEAAWADPHVALARMLRDAPLRMPLPDVDTLLQIDAALMALGDGHGAAFLRLPTPIRAAIQHHIDERGLLATRLRLHTSAVISGPIDHEAAVEGLRLAASLPAGSDATALLVRWHLEAGSLERAIVLVDVHRDDVPGSGELAFATLATVRMLIEQGEPAEGKRLLRLALGSGEEQVRDWATSSARVQITFQLSELVEADDALALLNQAATLLRRMEPGSQHHPMLQALQYDELARRLVRLGHPRLALDALERVPERIRTGHAHLYRDSRWFALVAVGELARVLDELRVEAQELDLTPLRAQLARTLYARRITLLERSLDSDADTEEVVGEAVRGWVRLNQESEEEVEQLRLRLQTESA